MPSSQRPFLRRRPASRHRRLQADLADGAKASGAAATTGESGEASGAPAQAPPATNENGYASSKTCGSKKQKRVHARQWAH